MAHVQRRCQRRGCRRTIPEGRRVCPACGSREASWVARYRAPSGDEKSQSFARKLDAERFLSTTEVAKARGAWIDPALGRLPFEAWADQWLGTTTHLRPSSRSRTDGILRRHLLPRFGPRAIASITTVDVRAFVSDLSAAGAAPATARKVYSVLRSILGAAEEAGHIGRSPCVGVRISAPRRVEARFLSPEEIAALADAMPSRYRGLVLLAAYGGLRFGELAGLRVDRVDFLRSASPSRRRSSRFRGSSTTARPRRVRLGW